jgi:glycosyltransferase involved in cell wall biosynthesis
MAKRSIAFCITDLEIGGAELAMAELASRLDWNRFEPVIYCLGSRPQSEEASCVPALEDAGVEFHFLDAQSIWQFQPIVRQLEQWFRRQKPDLVQSFLFHANLAARVAARRAGVPTVVAGLRVAEPRRWHLWTDRLTSGLVDCYVCVSQAVARFAEKRIGLSPEKLAVIPNGIEVEKYSGIPPVNPQDFGIPPGRRLATFVGRLEWQKGVRWLLKTAPRWLERLPDCDLLLVGQGPQEADLRQLCYRLAIDTRVCFTGWRADVPEILAASQLLVLPSRWEGMPNVLLQAMASRLPVVATDVEGVRELLGPEAERQTVPFGDSQRFADAVVRIMSTPRLASELGSQNRLRAEREFTLDRVAAAYQDLWTSLLEGRR